MPLCLVKVDFFETRKPENPKSLNPNPKADFSIKPEPVQTRKYFCNWNPMNPNPKAEPRPQPEPEEFWTRPITTKELYSKLIWRKKFAWQGFFRFSTVAVCTLWKNEKFTLTEFLFSSNHLFSNFVSKTITFTKFLPKKSESKFP